jgi:hypothetical protein
MTTPKTRNYRFLLTAFFITLFLFTFATLWSREAEPKPIDNVINGGGATYVLKTAGFPFNFISNVDNDNSYSILWHVLFIDLGFWVVASWYLTKKIRFTYK